MAIINTTGPGLPRGGTAGQAIVKQSNANNDAAWADSVPLSDNLTTSQSQTSTEEFIIRTSGGNASIADGDAWLRRVRGCYTHEGYVPENLQMTVTPAEREEEEIYDVISATIDISIWRTKVTTSGTTVFRYTTSWNLNPATYGITVTGTPINGDVITVVYVAEERGTIYQSNPKLFKSTGFNLYDYEAGYARVIKYHPTYGFGISGAYSSLKFSTTPSGTKSTISVSGGRFTIPSDGYVWVTGGDGVSTVIWMTWSDWQEGYVGDFEEYTESIIDLTSIMEDSFPNGLLAAGQIRDEINLSTATAISKIERLAYNATNIAAARASGRTYDYDTNWIYLEKETYDEESIEIYDQYEVSDHGLEFFTNTTVPVLTDTMYGNNLKNTLERNVLHKSQQTLTDNEKKQVRKNIEATVRIVTGTCTSSQSASNPTVLEANGITSDMVVINSVLTTPSAQTSDWTVDTYDGYLEIYGTISGSTDITLYLMHSDN